MKKALALAAKYNKALAPFLLLGAAIAAQRTGVDINVGVEEAVGALAASLLVYLVPNRGVSE